MGRCRGIGIATTLTIASLAAATSSSAAIEVGNECLANGYASDFTLLQLERAGGNPFPIAAPSAGVVTRWKVNSGLGIVLAENLRVFRPTGNPNEFQAIADSASEPIVPGGNVFETRIPVKAGDRFGAFAASPSGALYCSPTSPADVMGAVHFNAGVGSTQAYTPNPNFQVALSAIVEPDEDGDGFGDETQDRCPQSAEHQEECPRVRLTLRPEARERAIVIRVRATSEASVMVFGQVGWDIRLRPAARAGRMIVGLSGGTKQVKGGGATSRFRIPLPKSVLRRLGKLAPHEALKAKVAARSTDLAGRISERRLTVRLKGQEGTGP